MPDTATVATSTKAPRKAKASKGIAPAASPPATAATVGAYPSTSCRRAADILKQAADATRLRIIKMLASGERYVGDMSAELGHSQPAVSHHIALLRASGIIEARRSGKNNFYGLTAKGRVLANAVDAVMAEDAKG